MLALPSLVCIQCMPSNTSLLQRSEGVRHMSTAKHLGDCLRVTPVFVLTLLIATGCAGNSTTAPSSGGTTTTTPAVKQWTWSGGSNVRAGATSSVFGTEGIAAATNLPGGRSAAVRWTDSAGNFWLFGGGRVDPLGTQGPRNDLWQYSPTSKQWTWVSGSSTIPGNQKGIYGTLGMAAAANVPGGRTAAVSWVDANNQLWLFGGSGYDSAGQPGNLNDLWQFSTTTKQWTWVSGSNLSNSTGVYGTINTASGTNMPGARQNSVSWTDTSGNFWLFGGLGYDSSLPASESDLNDLWQFSPTTKQWTWISGTSKLSSVPGAVLCAPGVYGTQGTAAATNTPGGRNAAVSWTDANDNLWLLGGLGCDVNDTPGAQNDLWEFNTAVKTWVWQNGSNSVGAAAGGTGGPSGVYGALGTAAATNTPGGRSSALAWTDASGNLWLFGGLGHDSAGASGELYDLWSYTP